jgi:hypothetical protein
MKWRYHIPHTWEPPSQRMGWADVWLLPDDPGYHGESIWLTIDALGGGADDMDRGEFREEALNKLGDFDFWIRTSDDTSTLKDCDMIVRAEDFDRAEFLGWVQKWIETQGLKFSGLVEAGFKEFENSNEMARTVKAIKERQNRSD